MLRLSWRFRIAGRAELAEQTVRMSIVANMIAQGHDHRSMGRGHTFTGLDAVDAEPTVRQRNAAWRYRARICPMQTSVLDSCPAS